MIDDAYKHMSDYENGMILGADTGLNILVNRSDYLYPYGIMPYFMFFQSSTEDDYGNTGNPSWTWEGTTTYRLHHPTFYFSAGIRVQNLGGTENPAAETFELQVWVIDATTYGSWKTLDSHTVSFDATVQTEKLEHFKATRVCSYDIPTWLTTNSYTLQNDAFRVRLIGTARSGNDTAYRVRVFTAWFAGWDTSHLLSWETQPTIVDTVLSDAEDINPMINNQNYLKERSETNLQPMYRYLVSQAQPSTGSTSVVEVGHFAFHYRPSEMGRIYYNLGIFDQYADDYTQESARTAVRIYLESFDYFGDQAIPTTGGSYRQLCLDFFPTQNGEIADYTATGTVDLSTFSPALTPNETYKLTVVIQNYDEHKPSVDLRNLSIIPKTTDGRSAGLHKFVHLEQPAAVYINEMYADLQEMYDGDYQIEYVHPLVTWMNHEEADVPLLHTLHEGTLTTSRINSAEHSYIICHRMRWLKFIGPARIQTMSGTMNEDNLFVADFEESIGEERVANNAGNTTSVQVLQTLDLNSIAWLAPGMYYQVRDARVAYEDYGLNESDL